MLTKRVDQPSLVNIRRTKSATSCSGEAPSHLRTIRPNLRKNVRLVARHAPFDSISQVLPG